MTLLTVIYGSVATEVIEWSSVTTTPDRTPGDHLQTCVIARGRKYTKAIYRWYAYDLVINFLLNKVADSYNDFISFSFIYLFYLIDVVYLMTV